MTETTAPATEGCAICSYELAENDRHSGNDHEFVTVTEYLHRVPGAYDGVTRIESASMPDSGRMEYLEADLEKAGRFMWLINEAILHRTGIKPTAPSAQWLAGEVGALRELLLQGAPSAKQFYQQWRWFVLQNLNIPLKYYASSASREAAP